MNKQKREANIKLLEKAIENKKSLAAKAQNISDQLQNSLLLKTERDYLKAELNEIMIEYSKANERFEILLNKFKTGEHKE